MDERRVSLKIDVAKGVIELDAPPENFDQAVAKTMELTASLDFSQIRQEPASPATPAPPPSDVVEDSGGQNPATSAVRSRSRATKASGARPGRIGSFDEVKGLLTEAQERELYSFFGEKAPTEQGHQVLVALVKGEELLGRRGLTYNEIYTLMRLGGVKPLPKAIDVVLGRMSQDQLVTREGAGFAAKFLGREFVEGMPLKADKGS